MQKVVVIDSRFLPNSEKYPKAVEYKLLHHYLEKGYTVKELTTLIKPNNQFNGSSYTLIFLLEKIKKES